ncbi:MAG TPA: P1 family peptidase [Actinomycetota bacterium]|nr:P1 family peptidase [Actinomycetota bacterium]
MITRVPGIRVGHWTDLAGLTGCTVVLCPPGTVGSGEVRGGAPGTRETDLLRPGTLVQEVHAVLLTGGSAFGLAAADGVMRFLEERGIGFDVRVARVPIVPAAVLFDLGVGDPAARPGTAEGYEACARAGGEVAEGNVGAGTGATVAKLHGAHRAVKGGLGTTSREDGNLVVGVLAVVNAFGEVLDQNGDVLAGARPDDEAAEEAPGPTNTTLVVVATNAKLTKERANLLARAAHDGIFGAIKPAHTMWDGDTVFTLATGEVEADQRSLEELATQTVTEAIRRGVLLAESIRDFPSVSEGIES